MAAIIDSNRPTERLAARRRRASDCVRRTRFVYHLAQVGARNERANDDQLGRLFVSLNFARNSAAQRSKQKYVRRRRREATRAELCSGCSLFRRPRSSCAPRFRKRVDGRRFCGEKRQRRRKDNGAEMDRLLCGGAGRRLICRRPLVVGGGGGGWKSHLTLRLLRRLFCWLAQHVRRSGRMSIKSSSSQSDDELKIWKLGAALSRRAEQRRGHQRRAARREARRLAVQSRREASAAAAVDLDANREAT